jgi:predicted enzyme involved in methoxymalonyl-ACP biosynthesis
MAMEKAEAVTARTAFTPTKKNESVTDLVREHERQIEEQAENQPHGGAVSAS